jgi:hypothetical protein
MINQSQPSFTQHPSAGPTKALVSKCTYALCLPLEIFSALWRLRLTKAVGLLLSVPEEQLAGSRDLLARIRTYHSMAIMACRLMSGLLCVLCVLCVVGLFVGAFGKTVAISVCDMFPGPSMVTVIGHGPFILATYRMGKWRTQFVHVSLNYWCVFESYTCIWIVYISLDHVYVSIKIISRTQFVYVSVNDLSVFESHTYHWPIYMFWKHCHGFKLFLCHYIVFVSWNHLHVLNACLRLRIMYVCLNHEESLNCR